MTAALRRCLLVAALAGAALVSACAGTNSPPASAGRAGEDASPIEDPPRRASRPLILVAMPDSPSFRAVRKALVNEVRKEFDVVTRVVDQRTGAAQFGAWIGSAQPSCLVLMDNPTVRLYREYENLQGTPDRLPPAVVVMSSFLEELRAQLQNVTGVAYEVPGVTAFVNLRSVITRPVNRVGVVHRPAFRRFIERQRALAAKEQIALVPVEVPADPSPGAVRNALGFLRSSGRVDALWVLNDNRLLRDAAFLETAWRRELAALQVPVIVGVPTLVSPEARFGNFAVIPDLGGLGVQAANVIFELSESEWRAKDMAIELPVSTLTVVKIDELRDSYGLRDGALNRIDRVLE